MDEVVLPRIVAAFCEVITSLRARLSFAWMSAAVPSLRAISDCTSAKLRSSMPIERFTLIGDSGQNMIKLMPGLKMEKHVIATIHKFLLENGRIPIVILVSAIGGLFSSAR